MYEKLISSIGGKTTYGSGFFYIFKVSLFYSLRNIRRSYVRTSFTIFSISLIICLYTISGRIGASFAEQLKQVTNQDGIDIIIQSRYALSPTSSYISNKTIQKILKKEGIKSSEDLIIKRKKINKDFSAFLIGTANVDQVAEKINLSLVEGQSYIKKGEILIADQLAKGLGLQVGDSLRLYEDKKFKIVGTYETWINVFNIGIFVTQEELQEILGIDNGKNILFLSLKNQKNIKTFINEINKEFSFLKAMASKNFSKSLEGMNTILYLMNALSIITLILTLAIMINTFIIAINERKKEIGILQAIGWTKKMIHILFTTESVILSLMGSLIGFFISFPILYIIKENQSIMSIYFPNTMNFGILFEVIAIAIFVGVISVILPLYNASKVNIVRVLKDE
ncbi:MAG: hypothetical protein CSA86_02535 [Arcobacter sp.]|nr:MAG: hypothetical protein CSA86_02535 [Arcobacter sp.]